MRPEVHADLPPAERQAAIRVTIPAIMDSTDDLRAQWERQKSTKNAVVDGVSVALAARNRGELWALARTQLRSYAGFGKQGTSIIDTPLNDADRTKLAAYDAKQEEYVAGRQYIPPDRKEEVAVGKRLVEDLQFHLHDVPSEPVPFEDLQFTVALLIAQIGITVRGQDPRAKQNLNHRMGTMQDVTIAVVNTLQPVRREEIAHTQRETEEVFGPQTAPEPVAGHITDIPEEQDPDVRATARRLMAASRKLLGEE